MRLPAHEWPNTDLSRGALFFFQHIREMVAAETHESFRVMTLDTIARLEEALAVVEHVRVQRLPPAVLDPVFAEMKWSLGKDPVAKTLVSSEIETILFNLDQKKLPASDQLRNIRYLQERLRKRYKETLESKILETFPLPGRRLLIRQLAGFYCSHIINLGYSRQFILRTVDDDFFAEPVVRVRPQMLMRFFENFDGKARQMSVTTPIAPNCASLLLKLGWEVTKGASALRSPAAKAHYVGRDDQNFITTKTSSYDEEGAVRAAEHRLASLRAIAFIYPKPSTFGWERNHYVIRSKSPVGKSFSAASNTIGLSPTELRPGGKTTNSVKSYAKLLTSNFDEASTERLLNSINTCALARKSGDRELQLISLWSAIEVLLTEPEPKGVRIVHYVNHLAPCICLRYVRRQFVAVYETLLVLYKRPFLNLVRRDRHYVGDDPYTRFATLLLLPDNKPLRDDLLRLLTLNPLALNRVSKLHIDYGDPSKLHNAVSAHLDRVCWQLHRIYRARNDLVHAGRIPSFLDALILNAFEYYTATVRAVVAYGKRNGPAANVDQAVTDLGIDYSVQMRYAQSLGGQDTLSAEQIGQLIGP